MKDCATLLVVCVALREAQYIMLPVGRQKSRLAVMGPIPRRGQAPQKKAPTPGDRRTWEHC